MSTYAHAQSLELFIPTSMCWTGERIFIADNGDLSIKEIDVNGKVLAAYGRKGKGPGEYENIGSIYCGDDGIYVPDSKAKRITFLSYSNLDGQTTFAIKALNSSDNISECGEFICVGGNIRTTLKTLHLYSKQFEYVRSIGEDLILKNEKTDLSRARHQFADTEFVFVDNQTIVIFRPAPFEIGIIKDPFGRALFSKVERHDLIPKPWETEFVKIENESYFVGSYPRAYFAYTDASKRIMIGLYANDKSTIYEYNHRSGSLVKKIELEKYDLLISNLVFQNGQSVYWTYNRDTEKLQKRIF